MNSNYSLDNKNSLYYRTHKSRIRKFRSPIKKVEERPPSKKLQLVGEFSLTIDEKLFKKINPPETDIKYGSDVENEGFKNIRVIDNGPKYMRYINPYEKTVNSAMIDERTSKNKVSFKSKAFYEKAFQFSKDPANAKMDNFNPIFYYIANPNEYRFYNLDSI